MSWLKKIFKIKDVECICQSPAKSLSEASVGQRLEIKCLKGEEGTCQRLREMGFCESSIIEKVADGGALICKVCDSKLVISKKLAENIIVQDICQMKGHRLPGQEAAMSLLSEMLLGQRGIIDSFTADSDDCERIEEMGVTPGEEVEIVRYAPMGDPVEIKIRGYSLSLRKQEAERIKVKIIS